MKLKGLAILALLCVALGAFSVSAMADECGRNPASVLFYPYYNTNDTNMSVMTITNTCQEDVWVHIVWVPKKDCSPNNLWIELTAFDTITFQDRALGFQNDTKGFFYAVVVDGNYSTTKVDKDCLIGQELILEDKPESPDLNISTYAINAVGFQALAVDNTTEVVHLDGVEYTLAPRSLYFPRFFGQPDQGAANFFSSEIIFINLTGGMRFEAQVKLTIYNDNEVAMSEYVDIPCWKKRPLNELTKNTNSTWNSYLLLTDHNTAEPIGFAKMVETGWICLEGTEAWNKENPVIRIDNANVYAVLVETLGKNLHGIADLPWQLEDADYNNASLWPVSQLGE